MNEFKLSDVTVEYLDRSFDVFEQLQADLLQIDAEDSVSRLFMQQLLAFSHAASENGKNLLRFTTYIPLERLSHEMIAEHELLVQKFDELKNCCGGADSRQSRLYRKSCDGIYSLMRKKYSSMYDENDINLCFIRRMIPHHRAVVRMCRSAYRFGADSLISPVISKTMSDTLARLNKLEYLYHCVSGHATAFR